MTLQAQVLMRGDVRVMNTLTQWAKRAGNTGPAMIAISELMEVKERELFASQGATGQHGRWQEDRDITRETKDRHGDGGGTLRDTDALYNSLTETGDENAIRGIYHGMLRFGTKLGYASVLASGWTTKGDTDVPERHAIDFTQADREEFLLIIDNWISGRMAAGRVFRVPIMPSVRTFV